MTVSFKLSNDYWQNLQVTPQDVEDLHTILFERETPLTMRELVTEFIEMRVRAEKQAEEKNALQAGKLICRRINTPLETA